MNHNIHSVLKEKILKFPSKMASFHSNVAYIFKWLWFYFPLPSLNRSMKSRACFSITLIASKMLLLKTPWGWGPTSRPAIKIPRNLFIHVISTNGMVMVLKTRTLPPLSPQVILVGWETHRRGAWLRSVKWNISEEGVRSAGRDNWPERWLSAT